MVVSQKYLECLCLFQWRKQSTSLTSLLSFTASSPTHGPSVSVSVRSRPSSVGLLFLRTQRHTQSFKTHHRRHAPSACFSRPSSGCLSGGAHIEMPHQHVRFKQKSLQCIKPPPHLVSTACSKQLKLLHITFKAPITLGTLLPNHTLTSLSTLQQDLWVQ